MSRLRRWMGAVTAAVTMALPVSVACAQCPGEGGCCFAANGSPGCDDVACCEAVCAADPFCCDTAWDDVCGDQAAALCFDPACPGDTNGDLVVNVGDLTNVILDWGMSGSGLPSDVAPNCAIDVADLTAVILGWGQCTGCGLPNAGACDTANGTPYCDDAACCEAVCAVDPFCCETEWNQLCADQATDLCLEPPPDGACCLADGTCTEGPPGDCDANGGSYQGDGSVCANVTCPAPACPGDGDCCAIGGNPTTGCEDVECCELICAVDPFCCEIVWDSACADQAQAQCAVCAGNLGACCLAPGTCIETTTPSDCLSQGGVHFPGEQCTDIPCSGPLGACCLPDDSCIDATAGQCGEAGGTYEGEGTNCDDVACAEPPVGACCLPDGNCIEGPPDDCTAAGGAYQGDGTTCAEVTCLCPGEGDCCAIGGNGTPGCEDVACCELICALDPFCCEVAWDSLCTDHALQQCTVCTGDLGACCVTPGTCVEMATPSDCLSQGGAHFPGEPCSNVPCDIPLGACCLASGSCVESTFDNCVAVGGAYQGDETTCAAVICVCPGAGDCCSDHAGPGCDDFECCILICTQDAFCCEVTWDDGCADAARIQCTACETGCPGEGSCFVAHPTPGCSDADCCLEICATALPYCCETEWDQACVDLALLICGPPPTGACCFFDGSCTEGTASDCTASGGTYQGDGTICGSVNCSQAGCPGAGDCCASNGSPGCDNEACCTLICAQDPFCCENTWDGLCADTAQLQCAVCAPPPPPTGACCLPDGTCTVVSATACADAGGVHQGDGTDCAAVECATDSCPGEGSCFYATGTPGCSDAFCCEQVCAIDPVCCDIWWDAQCVDIALELCGTAACPGDGECFIANGTPGCDDQACCNTVCLLDPTCCEAQWDQQCADQANDVCTGDVLGACCLSGTECWEMSEAECIATGANFIGVGVLCNDIDCMNATCGPGAGECDVPNGTPGCKNVSCCQTVCAFDSFCCTGEWDQGCADQAAQLCGPGLGACCLPSTICVDLVTQGDCNELGGAYFADLTCVDIPCGGPPTGACCLPDGTCAQSNADDCAAGGGEYQGNGTTCGAVNCPSACSGAGDCCVNNGSPGCDDMDCCTVICQADPFCCDNTWDQICADAAVQQCAVCGSPPTGACCFADGSCTEGTSSACVASGGMYEGDGTTCGTVSCPETGCPGGGGDCCIDNGTPGCDDVDCCTLICDIDPFCCNTVWDQFCADGAAQQCAVCATGACCLPDGSCTEGTASDCTASGGTYQGDGTICGSVNCSQAGCPGAGDCCASNGSPGCEDVACCEVVCALDPFCCQTEWDGICTSGAIQLCDVCGSLEGACCLVDTSCLDGVTATDCIAADGQFFPGSACTELACSGACCLPDGSCLESTVAGCDSAGGVYQGDGRACVDVSCPPPGCGEGSCCVEGGNGSVGCDDPECCELICAQDSFCCDVNWDAGCATAAQLQCAACLCGSASGDCCEAGASPGCNADGCCEIVCEQDPFCCETQWDDLCATAAQQLCAHCTCPGEGDCCVSNGTPGCDDDECCSGVCGIDPYCCEVEWDVYCAGTAQFVCGTCVVESCPGDGDCCDSNGSPGCDDPACCEAVCSIEPLCCSFLWDGFCADHAAALCTECLPCPGDGDCCIANGTPGCDDAACCELICDLDPFCCSDHWDQQCATAAENSCGSLCSPLGACCLPSGTCFDQATVGDCNELGGSYFPGASCADVQCSLW